MDQTLSSSLAMTPDVHPIPAISLPMNEAFLPAAKENLGARATRPSLSYWRDGWLRLKRNKQVIELHAENPDYPTIIVQPGEPFEIEGLAVGLIRNTMLM